MDKESASKVAQVLRDARTTLLSVTSERDTYKAKCAAYERREQATKVASTLHDKGIERDIEFPELVARLEKEAEAGRLPEIARAAEWVGPQMSFGTTRQDGVVEGGESAFVSYLVGSVG